MLRLAHGIAKCVRKDCATFLSNQVDGGREVASVNAVKQKRRDFVLAFYWNSVMLTQSCGPLKQKRYQVVPKIELPGRNRGTTPTSREGSRPNFLGCAVS